MKRIMNFVRTLFVLITAQDINKLQSPLHLFLLTFMFGGIARVQFWKPAGLNGSNLRALYHHGGRALCRDDALRLPF